MTKSTNKKIKDVAVKATSKSLYSLAELFAGITCMGRCYEPKMPEKLKK